jgi:hypothetical protein
MASPTSTTSLTPIELIVDATRGFELLLGDDFEGGKAVFLSKPDSPAHGAGVGISAFLQAALGREDAELHGALVALVQSEAISSAKVAVRRGKGEAETIYPAGTEYKVSAGGTISTRGGATRNLERERPEGAGLTHFGRYWSRTLSLHRQWCTS